jgi:hypothetical protein
LTSARLSSTRTRSCIIGPVRIRKRVSGSSFVSRVEKVEIGSNGEIKLGRVKIKWVRIPLKEKVRLKKSSSNQSDVIIYRDCIKTINKVIRINIERFYAM